MKRHVMSMAMAALLVVPAGMASAGGWALATLDTTPSGFEAGETQQVGYRTLQHGVHPVDVGTTEIRFVDGSGEMVAFGGEPTGETGHYVAEVTLPDPGTYQWEVTLGIFSAVQDLGTVDVSPATGAAGGSSWDWMRIAFPVAAVLSAAAVALQVLALRRRPVLDAG